MDHPVLLRTPRGGVNLSRVERWEDHGASGVTLFFSTGAVRLVGPDATAAREWFDLAAENPAYSATVPIAGARPGKAAKKGRPNLNVVR